MPLGHDESRACWRARGFGVSTLVEGLVSTTDARDDAHLAHGDATGLGTGVLRRMPLAKRLSERELLTVVQAAPEWISEVLDEGKVGAIWQKATGAPMPPQLAVVVRQQFRALTNHHGEWLHPAVEHLRVRAQGSAGNWPTLQESIEAMVAPSVFHDAATAIRSTTGRDAPARRVQRARARGAARGGAAARVEAAGARRRRR